MKKNKIFLTKTSILGKLDQLRLRPLSLMIVWCNSVMKNKNLFGIEWESKDLVLWPILANHLQWISLKVLEPLSLSYLTCKLAIIPTSQGCCEDSMR